MRSLTYVSSARVPWTQQDLEELLARAREWNTEHGLTGMMLFSDGNFMQSVEGEDADVAEVFDRIRRDPRHGGILVILDEQVTERAFPGWTMGFRRTSARELGLEGYTDFLRDPAGAAGLGREGSAPAILLRSFLPPDRLGPDVLSARPTTPRTPHPAPRTASRGSRAPATTDQEHR